MSETTQEERDRAEEELQRASERQMAGIPVTSRGGGIEWAFLRRLLDDADKLARIESRCLLRSEVRAPEDAVRAVRTPGGVCWLCVDDDVDGPHAWYEPAFGVALGDRDFLPIIEDVD